MTAKSKSQARKHFKEIILLFSVPLSVVLVTMALIYVPRWFANPTDDFIYCQGYSCEEVVSVDSNGKIRVAASVSRNSYSFGDYHLYYYDASHDSTRPISLSNTADYKLDPSSKSPNDYTLHQSESGSGFLFWSDYSDGWSLKKGFTNQPISVEGYDVKLIGWVK